MKTGDRVRIQETGETGTVSGDANYGWWFVRLDERKDIGNVRAVPERGMEIIEGDPVPKYDEMNRPGSKLPLTIKAFNGRELQVKSWIASDDRRVMLRTVDERGNPGPAVVLRTQEITQVVAALHESMPDVMSSEPQASYDELKARVELAEGALDEMKQIPDMLRELYAGRIRLEQIRAALDDPRPRRK